MKNRDKLKMIFLNLSQDKIYKEILEYIDLLQTFEVKFRVGYNNPPEELYKMLIDLDSWLDEEIVDET